MSKVIDFNVRQFDFDEYSAKSNVGYRGFITMNHGNEEIWEIGDWGWNWTQLAAVITGLETNTDYVFRFAMTLGHNDDNREVSLIHIYHCNCYCEDDEKQAWNDRYTYCIGMSRFKPIISKRALDEDTMLRVFELPFNTGEHTDFKIVFIAQHGVARLFKARDNEAYADMEDLSYAQWRTQRTETLEAQKAMQNQKRNSQNTANIGKATEDSIREMIATAFEDAIADMQSALEESQNEIADMQSMLEESKNKIAAQSTLEDTKAEIADMLEDKVQEAVNDSISEFFSEGMADFLGTHSIMDEKGMVLTTKQRTKVLSPDKKKLLTCYGELKVEDTANLNGVLPKGFGLSVQTRISSWEVLYVYETEEEAINDLIRINTAIKAGEPIIEL